MRDERLRQTLAVFSDICLGAASLSEDNKHKVGAIVFRKNFQSIPAIAFNGNYPSGPNERDSQESGKSGYIHAEVNALLRAGLTPETAPNFAIMISLSPCEMCAKYIAACGVKSVFFISTYTKDQKFLDIFRNAGIRVMQLGPHPEVWSLHGIKYTLHLFS